MENILPRREARENAFLLAFSQTFGDIPLAEALSNHAENDEEQFCSTELYYTIFIGIARGERKKLTQNDEIGQFSADLGQNKKARSECFKP